MYRSPTGGIPTRAARSWIIEGQNIAVENRYAAGVAAKQIGLTIPPNVVVRADKVIK